jgi:hypothetical protein
VRIAACLILILSLALGQLEFISSLESVALYLLLYGLQAAVLLWVWKTKPAPTRRFVLCTSLLFRLALLPAGLKDDASWGNLLDSQAWQRFLLFDHDVWRFLWDPHVVANGMSPYAFPPGHSALDALGEEEPWNSVRSNLNYPNNVSTYPPGAQLLFLIPYEAMPGNPLGMKLLAIVADLGICALLPLPQVLLYAWNPLVLKVGAASAHFDSIIGLILLLVYLNRQHVWRSGLWLGAGALVKLSPLALLPWLYRERGIRSALAAIGVTAVGFAPFYSDLLRGLAVFGGNWQFNAGYFMALQWFSPVAARPISMATILAAVLWIARTRQMEVAPKAAWTMFLVVVLSPTVMPWYLLWCLPLAALSGEMIPVYFSLAAALPTLIMIDGIEHAWWLWVQHLPLAIAILWKTWLTFLRPPGNG